MKATNPDLRGVDEESVDGDSDGDWSDVEEEDGVQHAGEDDELSMAEASDAEDLVDLDADVPSGLIDFDSDAGSEGAEEEWGGFEGSLKKRKRSEGADGKQKKKKLRSLPTFASYDDYAKMIEDEPDNDL